MDKSIAHIPFVAGTMTLTGAIILNADIDRVFRLFSPLGEKNWVTGWDPEILAPRGANWAPGMVFRTVSDGREEIWVIAELDTTAHRVVYFRIEPGRLVARVEVRCRQLVNHQTEAATLYSYVGLSALGNSEIAEWSDAAYRSKKEQWTRMINQYLGHAQR